MKRKLVNKKVVNSIGIGIMAFITAATPVMGVAAQEGEPVQGDNNGGAAGEQTPGTSDQKTEPSAATKAVQDAQTENGGIIEKIETDNSEYQQENPGKETVNDEKVVEKLEGSQEALGTIEQKTEALDDLNGKADHANEELSEALNHANDGIDEEIKAIEGGTKSVEELEKVTTDQIVTDAKKGADSIVEAQKQTYENAEAAQTAKDKALAEAAEIEAAKNAALEKQEQAKTDLERADGNLTLLKQNTEAAEKKYNAAVEAVNKANAELEAILGDLNISADDLTVDETTGELTVKEGMSAEVKKALQDAWDALKQAEADQAKADREYGSALEKQGKAESAYNTAKGELDSATTALKDLTTAEKALDSAKAEEAKCKENYDDLQGKKTEVTNAQTAQTEAETAYDTAKKELKDAQQELLAGEANKQAEESKDAYDAYKQAKKKDKDEKKEIYIAKANEQTETMIKHQLLANGAVDDMDDITFSDWVSSRGDNNYVLASYPKKDADGNIITDENGNVVLEYKYYDYEYNENTGDVKVLDKGDADKTVYECGDPKGKDSPVVPLEIKKNDGSAAEYYLWGVRIDDTYEVIGSEAGGYTVKNPDGSPVIMSEKKETYWGASSDRGEKFELTIVTIGNKECSFIKGEEVASIEKKGAHNEIKTVSGKIYKTILTQAEVGTETKLEDSKVVFGPKFADKGSSNGGTIAPMPIAPEEKDTAKLQSNADAAKSNKAEKEDLLAKADERLQKANEAWDAVKDAEEDVKKAWDIAIGNTAEKQNEVDDIKRPWINDKVTSENVSGYLQGFIEGKTPEVERLFTELGNAEDELKDKTERNGIAEGVKGGIDKAYENVVKAIRELYNLKKATVSDEERWKELENKCRKAVVEYTEAAEAKGLSDQKCKEIEEAAKRAIEAANGDFSYNTPATGGDGGTTGGGTTGGGGGGTTGGTTGGTEIPTAPAVTLPEDAVPLAGAGITTPAAVGRTTGVTGTSTAADDGAANGAGAGSASGAGERTGGELEVLEDEGTPLAAPEDKKEAGTTVLEDEGTPLVAPIEEQSKMSWWWLLLIAVLGVTGEEMYRRHRKKMQEEMDS